MKPYLKALQSKCGCLGCVHGVGCLMPAMWDEAPPLADQWAHERALHARRLERVQKEREKWEGAHDA